ncbi:MULTISPECIES: alpha-amylase family protein [unclassified Oceanispirochaeta]|uniref:alpha-amylase family protein n=1 Tax=unclassified Oceanispirochaeta TaxID=2635722 RepID=UPI000E09A84F|nr:MULTISPECIES: alpha-amylase family protein [unclassified Oceanispirochaeta]MBF9017582.1 alpha-L-fucosidase [Oceanispirochaeta sp. M2]NPD74154.1 hypothetical protein [Oceanispirochaeta sp. M1]RDG30073.1 hypothetical protein DV872_18820 [Oceanispirochaeta sp. M1]
MKIPQLPNREIHLDFHTNGDIPGIASEFNPEEFASVFKKAGVQGVCLFSRGHHGYCYYPTEVGTPHPNTQVEDLLGEQYRALQKVGIVPSVYTTICWDELAASNHPEWLCQRGDGRLMKMDSLSSEALGPFGAGWQFVCWNSPYRHYVLKQSLEVTRRHPDMDYLFLDILFNHEPCACSWCRKGMTEKGMNPESVEDRTRYSYESAREFMVFINEGMSQEFPEVPLFFNSRLRLTGCVEEGSRPEVPLMGVNILESLPSGPWGYDHFPLYGRYFNQFDHALLGHTGKFQKMWGDFGGLKNQAALDFEVIRMMSLGVAASIGDQLPPRGKLDSPTYELIGNTYNRVKEVEKWLVPSTAIDEVGILLSNRQKELSSVGTELDSETGAMKMLAQMQYQYAVLDAESDFSLYKVLILADGIIVDDALKSKLLVFSGNGGIIILSNESGLDEEGRWNLNELMPLNYMGQHPNKPYYVRPGNELKESLQDTDHVQYMGGSLVEAGRGVEVLASITPPYFNREWKHFCSHLQTPPQLPSENDAPELLQYGNTVYFASPLFECYQNFAPKSCRTMFSFILEKLMDTRLLKTNLPTTAETTVRKASTGETVLTMIHYIHQRRTNTIDIIEDEIPLYDIDVDLYHPETISVSDGETGESLDFIQDGKRVKLKVDRISGYRVLVFA